MSLRPFFPFYGSKWNIARHYPAPQQGIVIEPFAGSAGYSMFYQAPLVRLFDADPIIVGVWSYLMRTTAAEIMALPEMPEVGDHVDAYDLPQEAKWLIGFWLNRGSAQPKKSRTAYSARTDGSQLNWGRRAKERIAVQLPALEGWSVEERSCLDVEAPEATWFVDPPYQDKGRYYRVGFNRFDELGRWCMARRGLTIVCEGDGASWLPFTPLGNFKSSSGKAREAVFIRGARRLDLFEEAA